MTVRVRVLWVDGKPHERSARDQVTTCSCGEMDPAHGGSSHRANLWRAHVEELADSLGVPVVKFKGTSVRHDPKPRPVLCDSCGWQGRRRTPHEGYQGPAGPCPRCGERLRAVRL